MAVLTLGLGVGATTAISSLFYEVLLRELPVVKPEQLVVLHPTETLSGWTNSDNFEGVFSYPMYRRLRDASGSVAQGVIARRSGSVDIMRTGHTDRAQIETVSGNFFQVLGVRAYAGRLLTPQDDTVRDGNDVAVLAYAYWAKNFADAKVVGQRVIVNGHPVSIIGVAPPDFRSVLSGQTPEIYMPISMRGVTEPGFNGWEDPSQHWLTIIGRLRKGVSRGQAQAALNTLFTATLRDELAVMHINSAHARQRTLNTHVELHSAASGLNELERSWKKPLLVLLFAAGGLLLIACSNLASLLMVRGAARRREIAIRRSLGATRRQVVAQFVSESLLLALFGSVLAICLSIVLTQGILHMLPPDVTGGWIGTTLDWRVLAFTLAISIACGIAFGSLPAWQVSGDSSAAVLREQSQQSTAGSTQARWRKGLVIAQIAICVILLSGAGLFLKSLAKLMQHDPGFHTENLLTFTLDPALNRYTNAKALNLYAQVRDRLAAIPGVTAVSSSQFGPYSNSNASTNISIEDYRPTEDENMDSDTNNVAPAFFHTLGIPLLKGREFTSADTLGAPKVVVVNEAFVKRFLRDRDAVGVHMAKGSGGRLDMQIIGVVRNAQLGSLREVVKPFYCVPFSQAAQPTEAAQQAVFLVRTATNAFALPSAIRHLVGTLDSALPVTNMETMQVQIDNSVYQDRAVALLTSAAAALALLLASLGLYGVLAYVVSRRTAEIGIRIALGATRAVIISLVMREVIWMVTTGTVIGISFGLALSHALAAQLFGVQATDIAIFSSGVLVLVLVAVVASAAPTLRAARIDPMRALRYE